MLKRKIKNLPTSHPLYARDTLYFIFDIFLEERDIRTIHVCCMINKRWRDLIMAKSEKYFNNYWNVATLAVYVPKKCIILQDSILDLLLVKLGIAPHKRDISNMIAEAGLFRISSLEDLTMSLCLDELIPDGTVGGNGQIYVCDTKKTINTTINSILIWLHDYLYVNLFPKLELMDELSANIHIWTHIEDAIDNFYYYFIELADTDHDKWKVEYGRYTTKTNNYTEIDSYQVTNILNKIKILYMLFEIYGMS